MFGKKRKGKRRIEMDREKRGMEGKGCEVWRGIGRGGEGKERIEGVKKGEKGNGREERKIAETGI